MIAFHVSRRYRASSLKRRYSHHCSQQRIPHARKEVRWNLIKLKVLCLLCEYHKCPDFTRLYNTYRNHGRDALSMWLLMSGNGLSSLACCINVSRLFAFTAFCKGQTIKYPIPPYADMTDFDACTICLPNISTFVVILLCLGFGPLCNPVLLRNAVRSWFWGQIRL